MSTTFKLHGPALDRSEWLSHLKWLLSGRGSWTPLACMKHLYPDAATDPFQKGSVLLLGRESARGVWVESCEDSISIELPALASSMDWQIAGWLLRQGAKLGGEVRSEEDQVLGGDGLTIDTFVERYQRTIKRELAIVRHGGGTVRFPVGYFELMLSPEDLKVEDSQAIINYLTRQCLRYGDAFLASRMKFQSKDGSEKLLAHYSTRSTLVPANVDVMTFSGPDGIYTDDPVPIDKVREVLANFMVPVGSYLYIPAMDWSRDTALLEALVGKSSEEIRESLLEQFKIAIISLPVLAMLMMFRADGQPNEKEGDAFLNGIKQAAADESDHSIFANACRKLMEQMRETMASLRNCSIEAEFLTAIGMLHSFLSLEAADDYKKRLYRLVETIANASRTRGFLGMGGRISEARQHALEEIQTSLFPNSGENAK